MGWPHSPRKRQTTAAPGPPCHTGGNNENEASFGWFPQTLANRPLYAVDFSRLFVDVVRQVSFKHRI